MYVEVNGVYAEVNELAVGFRYCLTLKLVLLRPDEFAHFSILGHLNEFVQFLFSVYDFTTFTLYILYLISINPTILTRYIANFLFYMPKANWAISLV